MKQLNTQDILTFILAGNARFTIVNEKTQGRFTYRIRKPRPNTPHFVQVLTGPDNTENYTYLGPIFDSTTYTHGKKSRISKDAPSNQAFVWFWTILNRGTLDQTPIKVYHEGRCGRCGRILTVPESIENGIGPECIKHIGG